MVRERDFNHTVGPNRTEADIYRTGYVEPNPRVAIAASEIPKIRELPIRRARLENFDHQAITGNLPEEAIDALTLFESTL
ncbi:MAG: hypothetical protein AAB521_03075 [Patescibacteria group bacterium]